MIEINQACGACRAGLYEECENPEVIPMTGDYAGFEWIRPCILKFEDLQAPAVKTGGGGGGLKDPSEITDATSTGRKRAAMLLPAMAGMICEWAHLKWAGGGIQPIVGCRGNTLAEFKKNADKPEGVDSRIERHHGPDKAVLNNAVGRNLHAICTECHHRWHELNDPGYGGERPDAHIQWLPAKPYYAHDPVTKAEEYDLVLSEEWWDTPKRDRETYPIDLPDESLLLLPAEEGILNDSENPFEEPLDPFTENGES